MSIVVVGSVAYDTVETPREKRERQLGGSASFFVVAARNRGAVRCVGVVGDDFRQEDLDLLVAQGGDVSGITRAPGKSFHWAGRYHDDMIERDTLATDLGVFADFQPEIPAAWRDSKYLFLANIHPALQMHVFNEMAGPELVALDTMNLWIDIARDDLVKILSKVDILLVNDGEARQLTGKRSLAHAAAAIREMGPSRVIIKKGEHGAVYFGTEGVLSVPAIILDDVVDPTGAGDCFAGGFMGSLYEAGATRDSSDELFRQAMVDGTVTASFCPEGFSVEGLLKVDDEAYASREKTLRSMMTP
ncbi:MAG: sugar/nucleoside kinase (ribokinase family) [Candidatus Krumholzibacteriia bacterium]|jgi:sugar/nucleoside kinase (ribokinase family)